MKNLGSVVFMNTVTTSRNLELRSDIYTVNSDIFARVLFSRNFAYISFVKIKSSQNREIILSFTFIGKSYPSREL